MPKTECEKLPPFFNGAPWRMSNADYLRDLALKMEDLCRSHPAYSQAWKVIQNASDHLQAMARCHEVNNLRPGTASSDVNVLSRAYLYNTTKK